MKNIASISNVTAVALIALMMAACGSDGTASDVENVAPSGAGTTVSAGQAGSGAVSGAPQTTKPGSGGNAVVVTGGKGATTAAGKGGAGGKAPVAGKGGKAGKAGAAGKAGTSTGSAGQAAPYVCPATSTLETGDTNGSIEHDGENRTYIVHVPASYDGKPVPLVIDYHPLSQTAQFEKTGLDGIGSGYNALSDSENFIVVWPQGINNTWNVGPCCTKERTVDDVGFSRKLVEKIMSQACIDPKRIYATGFSNGGGMAMYLACKAADIFASVAPASFDLLVEEEEPCHPSRPITVISYRGTIDPIVPYAGGESTPPTAILGYSLPTIHFLGAVGTFERFAELDGCTGEPIDSVAGSGCQTYTQCKDGVEVTLCTVPGGSHTWGDANVEWEMLKKHPMH